MRLMNVSQFPSDSLAVRAASISLVIPAYNEAEALGRAIAEADVALRRIAERYEIIVVDDGSHDATAEVVRSAAASSQAIRLICHDENRGYGAALRTGFAAAKCDLVVFTDADCQFDLAELERFVLLARDYHVVCGYRIDRQDSPLRCLYSRGYNMLCRTLLGTRVRDVDCALKLFRRSSLAGLQISGDGFLVNSELLTQASQRGLRIVEVGVTHRPRTQGRSSVSVRHIPAVLAALLRYWWNRVQFPGAPHEQRFLTGHQSLKSDTAASVPRWAPWLLLGFAALLLGANLGYPLIDRDETRYGEIPREMVVTGNWVLPQLNFRPYYDKPALLYWLVAASYRAFGVSPAAARVVPAACALATLALTFWFGSRVLGRRAALLGAAALLLSVGFLGAARMLLIDGLLMLLVTASLFAAYEAVCTPSFKWPWWIVASIAAGLGFLAKGPVALVLLAPPVAAFAWLTAGAFAPRPRHWLALAAIVAGVNLPWFVAVHHQDSTFAYQFFYQHNVARFAGAYHEQPFWYFVPVLLVAGHPWSWLTLPLVSFIFGNKAELRSRRPPVLGFLVLCSGWCVAFFSASRCKLPTYILPALPPLALVVGHYLDHVVLTSLSNRWLEFARRWSPRLAAAATCLGGIGFGIAGLAASPEPSPVSALLIIAWTAMLIVVWMTPSLWGWPGLSWRICTVCTLALAIVVLHLEIPQYARRQSLSEARLSPLMSVEQRPLPMVTVAHEWAGVPFEFGRNDVQNVASVESPALRAMIAENERMIVVLRADPVQLADLKCTLPPGVRLSSLAIRGPARVVLADRASVPQSAGAPDAASARRR
jgi:4-amino-4-deoxy-L-arabinose transferase-like glycosyltransferase